MNAQLELVYTPARETKTCAVYENGEPRTPDYQTLYLKKAALQAAGIRPDKALICVIREKEA